MPCRNINQHILSSMSQKIYLFSEQAWAAQAYIRRTSIENNTQSRQSYKTEARYPLYLNADIICQSYSTVTLFARLRGLSTSQPFAHAT